MLMSATATSQGKDIKYQCASSMVFRYRTVPFMVFGLVPMLALNEWLFSSDLKVTSLMVIPLVRISLPPASTVTLFTVVGVLTVKVPVPKMVTSLSAANPNPVSYTHLRAHETDSYLVCRLLLEK